MITEYDTKQISRIVKLAKNSGELSIPKKSKVNTKQFIKEDENKEVIDRAYDYWSSLSNIRTERRRNIKYKNGDQWSDIVKDPDNNGKSIREGDLIARNGQIPLKHNIIGQVVRNLVGQMLSNPTYSVVLARNDKDQHLSEMLTNALNACHQTNSIQKMDIAIIEELIVSGIGCVRVRYDYFHEKDRYDGKVDNVNINKLFFNSDIEDPRLLDLNFIGQLHEYSIEEIITNFASSTDEEKQIKAVFNTKAASVNSIEVGESRADDINFHYCIDSSKHRVYEVWQKKGHWVKRVHDPLDGTEEVTMLNKKDIDELNKVRIDLAVKAGGDGGEVPPIEMYERYEYYWQVKFIDSNGYTLKKSVSPYTHDSHPYVLSIMPMMDGEFKSYIADLIDMQRYINRLLVMIDFTIGASAKGVLMIPEDCIPEGYSVADFAAEYVKANGVIVYRPSNKGNIPMQISSNSNPAGAWNMLHTQLSLIEKVSGVSEAMQGRVSRSTAASLYEQQVSNGQINYRIVFETFASFIKERDEKLLKTLMQFYTEKRMIDIAGTSNGNSSVRYWEPIADEKIIDFNLVINQSFDTPIFRLQFEDRLSSMLSGGFIDFETYLKNSSMPFSQGMLTQLEQKREEVIEAQQIQEEKQVQQAQAAKQAQEVQEAQQAQEAQNTLKALNTENKD